MGYSRYEQETTINFNEEEQTATVYTYNGALQRKLAKLYEERPGEVIHRPEYRDGAVSYIIPKRWIKINAPFNLTQEQRAARSDRAKQWRKEQLEQS